MQAPDDIDLIVGLNIRRLRLLQRVSQVQLADAIGVTFQQVQKYERASNRISASKLYQVAQFFQVSVAVFYAGTADPRAAGSRAVLEMHPHVSRMSRAMMSISSEHIKQSVVGLVEHLATLDKRHSVGDEEQSA